MSLFTNLDFSSNFKTLTGEPTKVNAEDASITSDVPTNELELAPSTTAGFTSKKTSGINFFISKDLTPTSPDASDVLLTFAKEESREIAPISTGDPGRLSLVDINLDASRLGVPIDSQEVPPAVVGEVARTDSRISNPPGIREILTERQGASNIIPDNPTQVSGSGGTLAFEDINPSGSSGISSASFSSTAPGEESFHGIALLPSEKPRVLATLSSEVKNGYATRNAVFIKKLSTERGYATKYIILRKNAFKDNHYVRLVEIDPLRLVFPAKYNSIISKFGLTPNQVLVYEDLDFLRDTVYIYKVQVEWITATRAEVEERRRSNIVRRTATGTLDLLGNLESSGILFGIG